MRIALLLIALIPFTYQAQDSIQTFSLQKANLVLMSGKLQVFGLKTDQKKLSLIRYALREDLTRSDSTELSLGESAAEYQKLSCDTSHNLLSIHIQKKGSTDVKILRFDTSGKLVATINKTEAARLGNKQVTGDGYCNKDIVYTVFSRDDTSGRQFYLNSYKLKSPLENFDYLLQWQFAFERKNIQQVKVIFASSKRVLLFADRGEEGQRKQWLLQLDPQSGKLIKGIRLNPKGEDGLYCFGTLEYMERLGETRLFGEKVAPRASNTPKAQFFYLRIDSLGEITERSLFSVPITETKKGTSKSSTLQPVPTRMTSGGGKTEVELDIYTKRSEGGCFQYCNSLQFTLIHGEGGTTVSKQEIKSNPLIEDWLLSKDKNDRNGRLCVDSTSKVILPTQQALAFPVRIGYRFTNNEPHFLLQKQETARGQLQIAQIGPGKQKLALKGLGNYARNTSPGVIAYRKTAIVYRTDNEDRLILERRTW